jgi:Flp pilus assembly pilin Flp
MLGEIVPESKRRRAVAKMTAISGRIRSDEDGAAVLEYVLLLALIAIVCLAGVSTIGNINSLFFSVGNTL